mmetsp:Transcript_9205/g.16070  ORF Transcript_9205/g.16070 Transcript_9205/m.16070 type:complete len:386 (-) Transcript_9205:397-1554(-)|eukprot:CAMPEP_0184700368 /NCGR_PEP_ID=MMETSP0313-20130426/12588_1 /TAXON_ID=2792 /ORGANISM="Porphyridium aerugineum, Strain SAG 1380-2" /LENGTH=385 /DNA_ID=CAMNT_0027159999 /DNA_START=59 /DNA_END=1216 /DNA_ORIENTATION=+
MPNNARDTVLNPLTTSADSIPKTRVCIIGAGSIGALIGAKVAQTQTNDTDHVIVTMVNRKGKHYSAMMNHGLRVIQMDKTELHIQFQNQNTSTYLYESIAQVPEKQDIVFLGLKENQLHDIVDDLPHITHPNTVYVTLQNGIPWWHFHNWEQYSQAKGPKSEAREQYANYIIKTADPDGKLFHSIAPERIIGAVTYAASKKLEDGVILHEEGVRFPLGELDGKTTKRIERVSEIMIKAGFKAPIVEDIRAELWIKVWGSIAFNPMSALCHATLYDLATFDKSLDAIKGIMTETQQVGEKLGIHFRLPMERRIEGAKNIGHHKTSMLVDAEEGRQMEINAVIGVMVELGHLVQIPIPRIETLHGMICLLQFIIERDHVGVKSVKIT